MESPHLFDKHVPDNFILYEITYQTILHGFNSPIVEDVKKKLFIPYNFYIGHYKLFNSNNAKKEENLMLEFIFP